MLVCVKEGVCGVCVYVGGGEEKININGVKSMFIMILRGNIAAKKRTYLLRFISVLFFL